MNKIIIADDHPLILRGTKSLLETNRFHVIGDYNNGIEAYHAIITQKPNIAILDISMPGMDGIEVSERLFHEKIATKVILLTMHDDLSLLNKAKSIGVKGYLLKDFSEEELIVCLQTVIDNRNYFSKKLNQKVKNKNNEKTDMETWRQVLTPSEIKILEQISLQKSSKDIATSFFISEKTVEAHRSNIIKKLNLPSEKNSLIVWCLKHLN